MTNAFYNPTGNPTTGSEGSSALIRAEFAAIGTAFNLVPQIQTIGNYTTIFAQLGNYTFTLPSAAGTIALISDVTSSVTSAVAAETARAEAAEALKAPLASPALTGSATLAGSALQTAATLAAALASYTTTAGLTTYLASPPAIGGTARSSGAFTTVTAATGAFTTVTAAAGNLLNSVGRNRIDNGSMEIAQRSLPITTGGYTLDRWQVNATAGTFSVTQGTAAGYSSRNQLQGVFTGLTSGASVQIIQRIEAARSYDLAGQNVTFTVNVAYTVSAGTTGFGLSLYYANSTDNFAALTLIGVSGFTPSGTPGTYSATFVIPSAATTGLEAIVTATQAGATGTLTLNVTSVQLEAGSIATQFDRISPAQSLIACQRRYQTGVWQIVGYGPASSQFGIYLPFPVAMASTPTITSNVSGNANMSSPAASPLSAAAYQVSGGVVSTANYSANGTFTASADL